MSRPPEPSHMLQALRCGAKTRSKGKCCQPAMPNGRCRLHGGKSPGAPTGRRNGNYRTGMWTQEWLAEKRQLAQWARDMREDLKDEQDWLTKW